ncbi:MAG: hypothetical protein LBM98_10540 [Oscillospiraceae bacterium]|nr:hypothetical protein [Oscillospiraceae bacterium]
MDEGCDGGLDVGTGLGLLRAARNDGAPCGAPRARRGEGGFETRPYVPRAIPVQSIVIIHYQLSIVNCPNPRL